MDVLDLPPALGDILDGLSREVSRVSIASTIRRQLHQAQSPLSFVRRDAYASLAASLDEFLRDPTRAGAVLPALGGVWPELLQSIALGLRQAPPTPTPGLGGGLASAGGLALPGRVPVATPGSAGALAAAYRSVSPGELTCLVRVLEAACLLALQARRASLEAGLLPLLLAQLPAAPPELACAAMDALLAVQLRHPAAFVGFAAQGGVRQVSQLMKDPGTSEAVRSHTVQFLNLLLSQLVPDLLPPEAQPASPAPPTTRPDAPPSPNPAREAPCQGQPEMTAAVLAALDASRAAVVETLGREVWQMLQRRIPLSDVDAPKKLGQLSAALTIFIETPSAEV